MDGVLGGLLLAGAVHRGLLAAGAGRFLCADTLLGSAAAGGWFDHFEGLGVFELSCVSTESIKAWFELIDQLRYVY